ncbi:MAG: hypothetical protein P9M14_15560 [Candidatus Alcyoniella australis]|nr:hypothetical protein [Candidatus Alcyoniella australis]
MIRGRACLVLLILFVVISASPARAVTLVRNSDAQVRLFGYVKALGSAQDTWDTLRLAGLADQRYLFDDTLRLRAGISAFLWSKLQLECVAQARALSGDSIKLDYDLRHGRTQAATAAAAGELSALLGFGQSSSGSGLLDMQDTPVDERKFKLEDRIDRLSATLYLGPVQIKVGRSTVSWGPGLTWNPTDIASPFSPTSLDREEKVGVDMLDVSVGLGARGSLEIFAAPVEHDEHDQQVDCEQSALAGRFGLGASDVDFNLMGGWIYGQGRAGLDFTWTAGDGLVYGGGVGSFEYDDLPAFANAMLGYTYAFNLEVNPSLRVEALYNGLGEIDPDKYLELASRPWYVAAANRGYTFNLGRYLTAASLNIQPHPLVSLSATAIVNLNDGSVLAWPQLTWSILSSLELSTGMTLMRGPRNSEYGGLEIDTNSVYGDVLVRQRDLAYLYLRYDF